MDKTAKLASTIGANYENSKGSKSWPRGRITEQRTGIMQ